MISIERVKTSDFQINFGLGFSDFTYDTRIEIERIKLYVVCIRRIILISPTKPVTLTRCTVGHSSYNSDFPDKTSHFNTLYCGSFFV